MKNENASYWFSRADNVAKRLKTWIGIMEVMTEKGEEIPMKMHDILAVECKLMAGFIAKGKALYAKDLEEIKRLSK